ncbi:MAG: hypothetical protein ACRCTE_08120 [Cellulosilyticaceae bacterium]
MFGKFKKTKKMQQQEVKEESSKNKISDKDLEQIKKLLESKNLPIVILDNLWYQMREALSQSDISEQEKNLKELLKEQATLVTDMKEYTVVKQNLLQQVLVISQEVNEKGNTDKISELDKTSQAILKTNETIEKLEQRALEVGDLIESTNKELIESVVLDAYGSMEDYKHKKNKLEQEIDGLRKQVVEKTEEKKQYDKAISGIYNYLHKMIGYKYLDKVDRKLGE